MRAKVRPPRVLEFLVVRHSRRHPIADPFPGYAWITSKCPAGVPVRLGPRV